MKIEITEADKQRFFMKVEKTENGCWIWQGFKTADGYGQVRLKGQIFFVHRISYLIHKGSIEEGNVIDHRCRNRACVNPDHLEAVPPEVNGSRTVRAGIKADSTHCIHGHELTEENTYIEPSSGRRVCCTCRQKTKQKYIQKLKDNPDWIFKRTARQCKYGHEMTEANSYYTSYRTRQCLTCYQERSKKAWQKLKDNPNQVRRKIRTHCKYGHEFSEANSYYSKYGVRQCHTCVKARGKKNKEKQRANPDREIKRKVTHCKKCGREYTKVNTLYTPEGGRKCRFCVKENNKKAHQKRIQNPNRIIKRKVTHCKKCGNELSGGNVYYTRRGDRVCRICNKERKKAKQKKRENETNQKLASQMQLFT